MTGSNRIILVDTNIIIESVRTDCWNVLRSHYQIITVEKCREEAQSGIRRTPGYVVVKDEHLSSGIQIVVATDIDRARLAIDCALAAALDEGERELWAHAYSRTDEWQAACADQAAVRVAMVLGWGDRLISLEELVKESGFRPKNPLRTHYRKRILSIWRTQFMLNGA